MSDGVQGPPPCSVCLAETTAQTSQPPLLLPFIEEGKAVGLGVKNLGPASALPPTPYPLRTLEHQARHCIALGFSSLYPEGGHPLEALTYLSPSREIPLAGRVWRRSAPYHN